MSRFLEVMVIAWAADFVALGVTEHWMASVSHGVAWGASFILGAGIYLAVDVVYPRKL